MKGPYPLSHRSIDEHVDKERKGVYLLYVTKDGPPRYVGRSDDDLNERLRSWVGASGRFGDYRFFRFEYVRGPRKRFERECNLYHQHGGESGQLDNERHPDRPDGTDWTCPRCNYFDPRPGSIRFK